jgi:hypothetical protein
LYGMVDALPKQGIKPRLRARILKSITNFETRPKSQQRRVRLSAVVCNAFVVLVGLVVKTGADQ